MGGHDNEGVGSSDSDALPDNLVEALEQERQYLDEVDRRPVDLDLNLLQQDLSQRIQADTLRRLARNRLVIRILSAAVVMEAIVMAALLIDSPPCTDEPSVPVVTAGKEEPLSDAKPPDVMHCGACPNPDQASG